MIYVLRHKSDGVSAVSYDGCQLRTMLFGYAGLLNQLWSILP
jgi:hypothetical protein